MPRRVLVLFARKPRRQALDKGLAIEPGERLFAAFAKGWIDAAAGCGASVLIATPPDDRAGWRRALPHERFDFLEQRGRSLGGRLEDAARQAAADGGCVVLVGGDVPPSPRSLVAAFELRERGNDAAIAPARDGGVSLVSLGEADLDLLGRFVPRKSDVFAGLSAALSFRGRQIAVVSPVGDVDGRRELGRLLRTSVLGVPGLRALARVVLADARWNWDGFPLSFATAPDGNAPVSRGPPLAA